MESFDRSITRCIKEEEASIKYKDPGAKKGVSCSDSKEKITNNMSGYNGNFWRYTIFLTFPVARQGQDFKFVYLLYAKMHYFFFLN